MPKVKSAQRSAEKWTRRSAAATQDYQAGIQAPKEDWAASSAAAAPAYVQGVQQAIQANAFQNGVGKAGTGKWQSKSLAVGVPRFAQGIQASGDAYEKGFAPFRAAIEATQLPPRGPKGDPANLERARIIAQTLHETKLALRGRG